MAHMGRIIAVVGVLALLSAPASADYIAVGPIRGQECTSYILFESCEMYSVDAVLGDGDKLYPT